MMRPAKFLTTVSAAAVGIAMSATAASAVTFTPLPDLTDTEFTTLMNDGLFTEDWIAESRIGRQGLTGDFELDIQRVDPHPSIPNQVVRSNVDTDQFLWQNNQLVDFELVFDGSTVTYTVGGKVLTATNIKDLASINTLFIRTRSNGNGSIMKLANLAVNGITHGDLLSNNSDTVNYLKVTDLGSSFTLTGQSLMSWTGSMPGGSQVAYQIKAGYTPEPQDVSEPMSLLSLGLLGGVLASRRRRGSDAEDSTQTP